ncbi:MAG: rhomboid family intramembrane serine protease [Baekduia sp.]
MRERGVHTALALLAGSLALMWALEVADQAGDLDLERLGIEPRDPAGLFGIVFAPFIHGSYAHLVSNTVPLVIFGTVIALGGVRRLLTVTLICGLSAGLGTWVTAESGSIHVGASGIIFGYASFLMVRGLYTRDVFHVLTGVLVFLFYGGTILLATMPAPGISWQGHLFGALGGVFAAAWEARTPEPQTEQREVTG